MSNPYAGTVVEPDWDRGFAAGLVAADQPIEPPLVLSLESREAFLAGVQLGQFVNAGLIPTAPFESTAEAVVTYVHAGIDVIGPVVSAASKAQEVGKIAAASSGEEAGSIAARAAFWDELATAGLEIAFNVAVFIAIWGPQRDDAPLFSELVATRLAQVRGQIVAGSDTIENLELFMAVSDQPGASVSGSDPLRANGVWHGLFRETFDEARQDAINSGLGGNMYIHRYQTSQPLIVDVVPV